MEKRTHRPRLLWKPQHPSRTILEQFRRFVNKRRSLSLEGHHDIHSYSTSQTTAEDFWLDLFYFLGMKADKAPRVALRFKNNGSMWPPPEWFPEIKMNVTENLLSSHDASEVAIHACTEGAEEVEDITWQSLRSSVAAAAGAMRAEGIVIGDRVAGVLSNRLETVILCLATLSIGALWTTSSPDTGPAGVLDRLLQTRPKLLFVETDVLYNGKVINLQENSTKVSQGLARTAEFQNVIEIPRRIAARSDPQTKMITWQTFLGRGYGKPLQFTPLPFNHPGFIFYSSGTTGPPKCILHSSAGVLLQAKKDHSLHFDVRPGDTVLQYTTTGWIMWRNIVCGLGFGGRTVLYDGSPLVPDPLVLLRLVAKLRITMLGVSARFLSELKSSGLRPRELLDLSSLRTVTSTGSTLTASVAEWFYDAGFPRHVHLISTSGGTDTACSLISGSPFLPVYSGEIQAKSIGMAIDIADAEAKDVVSVEETGRAGELICTRPFPTQPVAFWGREGRARYYSSYFGRYGDNVWAQGDLIQMNPSTKGFLMLGRSDGVLNPSGVRFGSAEIYEVVEKIPGVAEALCVGQRRPQDSDEAVILFLKMKKNQPLTVELKSSIRSAIRTARTPRHVPKYIFEVPEIPVTHNGKKIETAVKALISGQTMKANSSIANPHALKYFERFYNIEAVTREEMRSSKL